MLERFGREHAAMAAERAAYQLSVLTALGALGVGPFAKHHPGGARLPARRGRAGVGGRPAAAAALPAARRRPRGRRAFLLRHDDVGAAAGLLPNLRTALAAARKSFRTALADAGELRAEWSRGLEPELRAVGCSDRLLAAAVADPSHYKVIQEDAPEPLPTQAPPRAKPRVTFYVDNTRCADPVDVWIDGDEARPGRARPAQRAGQRRRRPHDVPARRGRRAVRRPRHAPRKSISTTAGA